MMEKLIQNFSIKSIADFFKSKISSFSPNSENLDYIIDDNHFANFSDLQKIGEVELYCDRDVEKGGFFDNLKYNMKSLFKKGV